MFFIDRVANYRVYDDEGNPQNGIYANTFETEYKKLAVKPKYRTLFNDIIDIDNNVKEIHNGYFSIDKKGKKEVFKDSKAGGVSKDDETAYNLIMHDKEKLLSFDTKLRFIFSHSALKEGWDNPNVFQICTLNETSSEIKKRQEIGRGMRLAVNQDGERVEGFEVNTLTVMANESYEDFVQKLQTEIEEDEGIRFGFVEEHIFANIILKLEGENPEYLGQEESKIIVLYLNEYGYIDERGKVQDKLKQDLKENKLSIPEKYDNIKPAIQKLLKKVAGDLNIKNAENKTKVELNKAVYLSPEFTELWEKIKYKTTYRVNFNSDELIKSISEDIKANLIVPKSYLTVQTAKVNINRGGVNVLDDNENSTVKEETYSLRYQSPLPDIVSYLQNETNLTRKTIVDILLKCERLEDFKANPQKFMEGVVSIIKTNMRNFIIDGIVYEKIGDRYFYKQELFENEELYGHIMQNMIASSKSPYSHVVYDSIIEKDIADEFERCENIKVYTKLPGWFKIDTPLGTYNPDWAILWENENEQKLYFVAESKGSISWEMLRPAELSKIKCGKKHFEAIDPTIKFEVINGIEGLIGRNI